MTLVLDPSVRAGAAQVAALCTQTVLPLMGAILATKRPVVLLIRTGQATTAFGLDGAPMPIEEVDHRHPGALALIAARGWL